MKAPTTRMPLHSRLSKLGKTLLSVLESKYVINEAAEKAKDDRGIALRDQIEAELPLVNYGRGLSLKNPSSHKASKLIKTIQRQANSDRFQRNAHSITHTSENLLQDTAPTSHPMPPHDDDLDCHHC